MKFLRFIQQIHLKPVPQRGDTIVEVMIALSVIGLVLGASFGIANTAVRTGRAAQERTEALKIAESQLEFMKGYYALTPAIFDAYDPVADAFCVNELAGYTALPNPAVCENTNGAGGDGLYDIAIAPNVGSPGTYRVDVTWDRINTNAAEQGIVTLYYRVGAL